MTVEIAVINKEAVAVAADSAVTIGGGTWRGMDRVYESAQKLFDVSPNHPIGIMVYNNASFMGIPWETVVGMCRASLLETERCNTLGGYVERMVGVLKGLAARIPEGVEEEYVRRALRALFGKICSEIKSNIETEKQRRGEAIKGERVRRITLKVLGHYLKKISDSPDISAGAGFDKVVNARYRGVIQEVANQVFEVNELRLGKSGSIRAALQKIGANFFSKNTEDFFSDMEYSGLVIAGFGEEEIFPSVITLHIMGALQGVLMYHEAGGELCYSVDFDRPAAIIAFARGDVIEAFKYGVWPDYIEEIKNRIDMQCFESFVNSVPSIMRLLKPTKHIKELEERLVKLASNLFSKISVDFELSVENDRKGANEEWERLISVLPRSELAEMARTLVRFTCFYWRYREEQATVKEPVRVAVISKNEGFRWMP